MNKNDIKCLVIALLINIVIILLLPNISVSSVEDQKISVGLVEFNSNKVDLPEKNLDGSEDSKNLDKTSTKKEKPKEEPSKTLPEEKEEIDKKPDEKKEVKVEKKEDQKVLPKEDKEKEPEKKKEATEVKREEKKETSTEKPVVAGKDDSEDDSKDSLLQLLDSQKKNNVVGLPQGYRYGSVEDGVDVRWDSGNRLPTYPESAELKGRTGSVYIKVVVGGNGRVRQVVGIKGTGVPELKQSIDEIARTWRIYLSKNGQRIEGSISIEVPFRLIRGE